MEQYGTSCSKVTIVIFWSNCIPIIPCHYKLEQKIGYNLHIAAPVTRQD